MAMKCLLLNIVLGLLFIHVISSDNEVPTERGLNWAESLPAVAMDYKVHIDAGETETRLAVECY